jgi:hypothetical protein
MAIVIGRSVSPFRLQPTLGVRGLKSPELARANSLPKIARDRLGRNNTARAIAGNAVLPMLSVKPRCDSRHVECKDGDR